MLFLAFAILVGIITVVGVEAFRRWSLKRNLIDVPNARSSHSEPVPRGGGLVIAIVVLFGTLLGSWVFGYPVPLSYLIASALIAAVSWLDDVHEVSFVWRLLVHLAATGLVVFDLGYWHQVDFFGIAVSPDLGVAGIAVTIVWIVGITNAYNFMDGIDGIAGGQAVVAGLGWFAVGWMLQIPLVICIGTLVASSSVGFLVHNWQPAKIFMGDVGSAFLGFTFGVLPLLALERESAQNSILPLVAVLLVWPFVFDSGLTLVRRAVTRQKIWHPHREHLYQRMVISGWQHKFVAKIYMSAASVTGVLVVLSLGQSGFWVALLLSFTIILSAALVIAGRKKRLT